MILRMGKTWYERRGQRDRSERKERTEEKRRGERSIEDRRRECIVQSTGGEKRGGERGKNRREERGAQKIGECITSVDCYDSPLVST